MTRDQTPVKPRPGALGTVRARMPALAAPSFGSLRRRLRPSVVLDCLPVVLGLGILAVAVTSSRFGLDLFDESYILSLISDPGAHRDNGEIFLFGFLVHPVFVALGEDVAMLRVTGLCVLGTVAAWMAHVVLRHADDVHGVVQSRVGAIVVVAASVGSAYAIDVRVPGYRTVTLLGLMLVTIGLVWAARGAPWRAGALMGSAWWLTVTGRPTTGVAALLLVPVVLLLLRALSVRIAIACAFGASLAVGLTLVASSMGPVAMSAYLFRGYTQVRLLGTYSSLRGMLGAVVPELGGLVLLGLPVLAAGLLVAPLWRDPGRFPTRARVVGLVLFLLVLAVVVSTPFRVADRENPAAALPMGLVIPLWWSFLLLLRGTVGPARPLKDRRIGPVLLFLAALPYAAALGTNSQFSHGMSLASTFWVLGAVVAARAPSATGLGTRPALLLTAAVCLSVPATFLAVLVAQVGLVSPQAPLRVVSVAGGTLKVTPADAAVLNLLSDVRTAGGPDVRTPVADLTGVGSGYRFQLGPHPVGRASFFGIFPGAEEAARSSLSWEPCEELARAWLIYARDNPYDVSPAFTQGLLSLSDDYETVAAFSPTQGPADIRGLRMQVLRPTPSVGRKLGC